MRYPTIVIFLAAIVMTGCVSSEQRAAIQSQKEHNTCLSYGLKYGTPEYAQCRMQTSSQNQQAKAANTAAVLEASAKLMEMGRRKPAMNVTTHTYTYRGRVMHCTTTGGFTNCN